VRLSAGRHNRSEEHVIVRRIDGSQIEVDTALPLTRQHHGLAGPEAICRDAIRENQEAGWKYFPWK
jgi:hypothetical protein